MSVTVQTPRSSFTGNGVTTAFSFSFLVLASSDLIVQVAGVTKVETVDYTVTGVGNPSGGTVTFTVAPASGAAVFVQRDMDLARATDYQDNGDLLADTLNEDLDRLWLAMQDMDADFAASVFAPLGYVSVMDYGAVEDGITDDTSAVSAAAAAVGSTFGVDFLAGPIKMTSALALQNQPLTGRSTTFSSLAPLGITGLASEFSGRWFGSNLARAGSATPASANQAAVHVSGYVPVTGAAATYEKMALYARIESADPARDAVGAQLTGIISASNTNGRIWGAHALGKILAGGDGHVSAFECKVINNGTDVTDPDATLAKNGLHVALDEGNGSAGILIGAASTFTWEHGIYIRDADVASYALSVGASVFKLHADGRIGIGTAAAAGTTVDLLKNMTGATTSFGIHVRQAVQSDVTTFAQMFRSNPSVANSAFTLTSLAHFYAAGPSIGGAATVTNQYGFLVAAGAAGATNNYGFYSDLAAASNVWAFYGGGTAKSRFGGSVFFALPASVTPTTNGDLSIQLTSDTSLTFKVKGLDGNLRSGSITLS